MIQINLLPQEERVQKKRVALPKIGAVVPFLMLAVFFAAIVAITAIERSRIAGLKRDIARAEEEARRLKPQIDKINELTRKREELNTRLQIIQDLDKGRFHSVRLMDELAQNVPPFLWVTSFKDQAGGRVTIDGVTFSNLVVADLMMRLEKTSVFQNTDLVVTEKGTIETRQVTKFSVTAEIVPGSTTTSEATAGDPMAWSVTDETTTDEPEDGDGF
jgi:type IV pilus assembly protein PilN